MVSRTFEVRDVATFIPVLAIKLQPSCEKDRYLLERAGYGTSPEDQSEYIFLCRINGGEGKGTSDPYCWGQNPRTIHIAHKYIIENFDNLESGAVICVETIMGERSIPKISECNEI